MDAYFKIKNIICKILQKFLFFYCYFLLLIYSPKIHLNPLFIYLVSLNTVSSTNIGTLGKYDQRQLWK